MLGPNLLFHASAVKGLKVLNPKRTLSKDKYIGDFVFATPSKPMASMYLAPREGGTILIEAFNDEPYAVINNTSKKFQQVDRGGSIYTVSSTSFSKTPQEELIGPELVSILPVVPISEKVYDTSLSAMKEQNVKVFFVNNDLFHKIQSAKDHGIEILSTLTPYQ